MGPATLEAELKNGISELRNRLEEAAGIAKAAHPCTVAGNISEAIEIALDVEQLIYEVNTILNAASLTRRISRS